MFAFIQEVEIPPLGSRKSFTPIDEAKPIEDVGAHIAQAEFHSDVRPAINLQEAFHRKYSRESWSLEEQKTRVTLLLEEAKANLLLVDKFRRTPGEEHQNLMHMVEGIFRWVTIPPVEKVILQVNPSTLQMEFSLPEAVEFLTKDITRQQQLLLQIDHDIDYLEDQLNIIDINIVILKMYRKKMHKREKEESMKSTD